MKGILISLLFFFGPVILMFVLRYGALFLRLWLLRRRQQQGGPDIIDITPHISHKPSIVFIVLAIAIGLLTAVLAWQRLTSPSDTGKVYIPAHVDQQGKLVPGHFQ
jgi:hypothetical protein